MASVQRVAPSVTAARQLRPLPPRLNLRPTSRPARQLGTGGVPGRLRLLADCPRTQAPGTQWAGQSLVCFVLPCSAATCLAASEHLFLTGGPEPA